MCELRLLAVERGFRASRLLPALLASVWRYCLKQGYDVALISGTTRQLKLYRHLGFVPFGPLVGREGALFQPMMLTIERFGGKAPRLFRSARPGSSATGGNFLPGPVAIHPDVCRAFQQRPESHRGEAFAADFERSRRLLCQLAGARRVEILLGSGTIANDAVAGQLARESGAGLILTNGEFGERLVDHARRFRLAFEVIERPWGEAFDRGEVERRLSRVPAPSWLWFVHGETSTGVLNDLERLKAACRTAGVRLCVDAISSFGTVPMALDGVYFASGVSGKGLGAFPGLALVFYDHDLTPAPVGLPRYLDLGLYAARRGVPFTHSSNLLRALQKAVKRVDWPRRFAEVADTSAWLRARLRNLGFDVVAAEAHAAPGVVTIRLPSRIESAAVAARLADLGFLLNANSEYLRTRNWIQICVMGESLREQLAAALSALHQLCSQTVPSCSVT
jgi:aspartate aminotransferase-like enzyme